MCTRSVRFEPFNSDGQEQRLVQQEQNCKFTCKLLCCKCSFCYRVATKERHKSQLLSQLHRNKICERCFLCRSLELCKSCQKCPNCCHRSTCRGKATQVLEKIGNPRGESKGSNNTQRGLHPPLPVQTQPNQIPLIQLSQPAIPTLNLLEALYQLMNKNAVEPVENKNSLGFYNQLFLVPKPNNRWRPILDLSTLNTFLNTESFKMKTPTVRGVGNLHRFQRRILPHSNSQLIQEVHAFSRPGSLLPIQSSIFWRVHSTNGVHSGGQRGQTDGFTEGYKNPPVPS